jgi:hypothetical protein
MSNYYLFELNLNLMPHFTHLLQKNSRNGHSEVIIEIIWTDSLGIKM